jgi:hypothetical protein
MRPSFPTIALLLPLLFGAPVTASNDTEKEEAPGDEELTAALSPAVTAVLGILALILCCFYLGRK